MTIRKYKSVGFIGLAAALLLSACANQMEPAQQAIAGIESAIGAASSDAGKYVPDQLSGVQSKLGELKTAMANKDYKAVLAGAPAVLTEAQGLLGAAAIKKSDVVKAMGTEWTAMAATLPALVGAVTSRIAVLGKSKHLPAGVDLPAAKTGAEEATSLWAKAQGAFAAGNVEEAVTTAKIVKDKAEAAAKALNLALPMAAAK